ncbi:MAG: I78 family peptidase inhibitor [Sphingomicrobium sp.]
MRRILLFASVLLAACATNPPASDAATVEGGPPQPIPIHGVTPGHKCLTEGTGRFVGQPGTSKTGAAIKRVSRAAVLRWAPPGYMLTMDYREDRVTVYFGPDRKVTKISCG